RIVAGLGHQDEADVIRLRLLLPAPRKLKSLHREPHYLLAELGVRAEPLSQGAAQALGDHLLADALGTMMRQHAAHLATDDSRQTRVILGDWKDAGIHRDLATRQSEGIRLLLLDDLHLPGEVRL